MPPDSLRPDTVSAEPHLPRHPRRPHKLVRRSLELYSLTERANSQDRAHQHMRRSLMTRRTFASSVLAGPFVIRAQPGPLRARIKIDTERVIGEIDPKLYGNFIEHLGRCIEGGVFDERSPLADDDGFRKDVLKAARDLNVSILRWPGGNFSSNYHWADGIGPRDKRPPRLEMAWGTVESNRFGTHEFLNYTEKVKSEPYICCNLGTGTWN